LTHRPGAVHNAAVLRALLLDLDGTLVDTPQAIVDVTQATLAALGRPPADAQAIRNGIGLPLPLALAGLLGTGPVGAADAVEIYRVLWRAQVTPRLGQLVYPGVHEGLRQLREIGVRLAVVTGKGQEGADSTVDGAGLRPYLEVVLGYTSVPNPKPAPDLALEALRRLRLPAADCAVAGDAHHDIEMAKAAGLRSIAVTYGAQAETALRKAGPTWVAHSFADVVRIARAEASIPKP
jgi:phosphoglycolate phosphatase